MVPAIKINKIYPLLKECALLPSKRSTYHHLEPIGIGTPAVESLTSYISRLAAAHSVSLATLYEFAIVPALNKPYLAAPSHLGPACTLVGSFRNQLKNINGLGKVAREWSELLEDMTLWPNLQSLTFLPWSEALTYVDLLKPKQAWCPACYNEMLSPNRIIYQPLIWSVYLMQVCVHHRMRLVDQCPKCNRQFFALARRIKNGFCPRCYSWLGKAIDELASKNVVTGSELEWQEFIYDNVGELIGTDNNKKGAASKSNIVEWLYICADEVFNGKVDLLAEALGNSNFTVHSWYYDGVTPKLSNLLRICYCLNIRLVDLLTGYGIKENKAIQVRQFPSELTPAIKSKRRTPFNYVKVKRQLERYLKLSPPISLKQVSIEVGYDRSTLSKNLPELCRQISFRYKEYLQERYRKHQELRVQEVQEACLELHKRDVYLTARCVANFLSKPSYLGRRDVWAIILAMRKQLDQSRK
jgi:hypothetical protein